MYMYGARFRAQPFLSKMRALEIGRAKRKSNDGKIKKTNRQYVTNETSRYKSHFCIQYLVAAKSLSLLLVHPIELSNQPTNSRQPWLTHPS